MTTTETTAPRKTVATYVANYSSSAARVQPLADRGTDIDFDTRITMALAGMDAILSHKHGKAVAEAHAAVTEIQDEILITLPEPEAQVFQPHPILKAAGDVIRDRGWHQGDFQSECGPQVCALGAIKLVTPNNFRAQLDAQRELLNRIAADTGEEFSVPMWNDSRDSVGEIIRLLY